MISGRGPSRHRRCQSACDLSRRVNLIPTSSKRQKRMSTPHQVVEPRSFNSAIRDDDAVHANIYDHDDKTHTRQMQKKSSAQVFPLTIGSYSITGRRDITRYWQRYRKFDTYDRARTRGCNKVDCYHACVFDHR